MGEAGKLSGNLTKHCKFSSGKVPVGYPSTVKLSTNANATNTQVISVCNIVVKRASVIDSCMGPLGHKVGLRNGFVSVQLSVHPSEVITN